MQSQSSTMQRLLAAATASAMSVALMAAYFAAPVQTGVTATVNSDLIA